MFGKESYTDCFGLRCDAASELLYNCMMDDYERSYKQLVASVGASLKKADLETLDYFYREPLSRARGRADEAWTGLGLLRTLEEAGVFSARRPEGLAGVMSEVPREDQRAIVEKFICKRSVLLRV